MKTHLARHSRGLAHRPRSDGYVGAGQFDDESIRTIHRALDLGVSHIDTAEGYGPFVNEELVGRAVQGRRDEVVLATKFGLISHTGGSAPDSTPANIRLAVEGSLKLLGTDYIDLCYQPSCANWVPASCRTPRLAVAS
jgi:aryl-alcohol dehydrogenase-like predicted oxidoreductase